VPHLFRSVYTGTRADRRRALDMEDMKKVFARLLQSDAITPAMKGAQELFILMFLLRGLPFVDLAYLRKSDLRGNVISYRRRKTGRPLSVTLTTEAMFLLQKYMNREEQSPYLFPILHSDEGSPKAYREYQLALRNFNYQLELLGKALGLKDRLSSYTARHTWATTAYYCEIHPGIISEAMGHSSITVTETYLKPFRNKKIDEANMQVLDFIKRSVVGVSA
jgi:integrase